MLYPIRVVEAVGRETCWCIPTSACVTHILALSEWSPGTVTTSRRGPGRRHPERIALALNDQCRHGDRVELGQPALGRIIAAAGRVQRERKAEDSGGAGVRRGPARDARARGTPAGDQRKPRPLPGGGGGGGGGGGEDPRRPEARRRSVKVASNARKRTALAISSDIPQRFMGTMPVIFSLIWAASPLSVNTLPRIGVSPIPFPQLLQISLDLFRFIAPSSSLRPPSDGEPSLPKTSSSFCCRRRCTQDLAGPQRTKRDRERKFSRECTQIDQRRTYHRQTYHHALLERVIESLGARFVVLEIENAGAEDKGGYAKAMSEDFYRRQREALANVLAEQNVVITTAAVPGRRRRS